MSCRVGQVVIALTPTSFLVWPKSHLVAINPGGSKFYPLSKKDLASLEREGCRKTTIMAQPGDVLFFLGGQAGARFRLWTECLWGCACVPLCVCGCVCARVCARV